MHFSPSIQCALLRIITSSHTQKISPMPNMLHIDHFVATSPLKHSSSITTIIIDNTVNYFPHILPNSPDLGLVEPVVVGRGATAELFAGMVDADNNEFNAASSLPLLTCNAEMTLSDGKPISHSRSIYSHNSCCSSSMYD